MSHHHRSTRAWRRHDRARLKAVRARYWSMFNRDAKDSLNYRICLGKVVNTAAQCSCFACGNPRRRFKDRLTLGEKKAIHQGADGWREWSLGW